MFFSPLPKSLTQPKYIINLDRLEKYQQNCFSLPLKLFLFLKIGASSENKDIK